MDRQLVYFGPRALLWAGLFFAFFVSPFRTYAEGVGDYGWQVLAVSFPADRTIEVGLGGGEKTLTARGTSQVKWHDNAAIMYLSIENLQTPTDLGWSGAQYVLWAVDPDLRVVNLGLVPMKGTRARWKVQVPFRVFGLLVTAEKDPKAPAPGRNVAMESRLPTDPDLVVPIFRVALGLAR